jgi:hypothetical protein
MIKPASLFARDETLIPLVSVKQGPGSLMWSKPGKHWFDGFDELLEDLYLPSLMDSVFAKPALMEMIK